MIDLFRLDESQSTSELCTILWGDAQSLALNEVDWQALFQTARVGGLVALMYDTLRKKYPGLTVPVDVWAQMEGHYRTTQTVNITMGDQLAMALRRLAAADIPVIVLKGAALSELVYEDIGLRSMADLDLLVKPEHAERAITLLQVDGYRNATWPELRRGFNRRFKVAYELITPQPFETILEIHWRLVGPLFACRYVDDAAVWQRAIPVTIVGQPAYTLGAEDWVLNQAAHAFYKHRRVDLLTLVDLDRLIRYLGSRLDWDRLMRIAEVDHWQPALAAVFLPLIKFANSPIPQKVIQFIKDYRSPSVDAWLLRWWLTPGLPERYHIFPDWVALPTLEARLFVVEAYLFPNHSYIEALYPGKPAWQLPYLYLRRFWNETVVKNSSSETL